MKKVLFIAPHPDDESFGCGGTIFKHIAAGDQVYWLIVTTGYTRDGFTNESLEKMSHQVSNVSQIYGFTEYCRLEFPTTLLDATPMRDLVSSINTFINRVMPDTIYVNYKYDVHTDHQRVFDAVWSCSKSFRNPFVKDVLAYETLSETEFTNMVDGSGFRPTVFHDITPFMEDKNRALLGYSSELDAHPFPRSWENVEALAKLRGATINVRFAESFMCLKRVE
jgi:N-acetylglucosamine malate deacetylase 1